MVTHEIYVIVRDVDAHCENARKHGAKITKEPHDPPYGGRYYHCEDTEGYSWCFGNHDPFDPTHETSTSK